MLQKVVRGDGTLFLWETGHFIVWDPDHLTSGIRDIFLGNGTFYPLGRNLSSGIRTAYPLGSGPLILWNTGHPLGNGPWETDQASLWDPDQATLWDPDQATLWDSAIWEMVFNPSPV